MTTQIFSYRYPVSQINVSGNQETWQTFQASNASTATRFPSNGNSSIIFNLASNSQFLRTHQSWFQFTITPRNADGTPITGGALAGITNSKQGCSRAFNRIIIRQGSTPIEQFEYDDQLGLYMSTLSDSRRKWLRITESFGNTTAFANGPRKFAMQIFSSLFVNPQALPLPALPSGLQIEFQVADAENLFTSNVPQFTVDNPQIRSCMICPDPSFTLALTSAVAQGRSAWIPMSEVRTFRTTGLGTDQLLINAAVGSYSSVDSVTTTFWDQTAYSNRGNDRYMRFTRTPSPGAALTEWSIEAAGLINPQSRTFIEGGPDDPESLMYTFLSDAGSIHAIDQVANLDIDVNDNFWSHHYRVGLNYQSSNEEHASGLSLVGASSTNVVFNAKFSNPIQANIVAYTTIVCSVLLEISGTLLTVHRVF